MLSLSDVIRSVSEIGRSCMEDIVIAMSIGAIISFEIKVDLVVDVKNRQYSQVNTP